MTRAAGDVRLWHSLFGGKPGYPATTVLLCILGSIAFLATCAPAPPLPVVAPGPVVMVKPVVAYRGLRQASAEPPNFPGGRLWGNYLDYRREPLGFDLYVYLLPQPLAAPERREAAIQTFACIMRGELFPHATVSEPRTEPRAVMMLPVGYSGPTHLLDANWAMELAKKAIDAQQYRQNGIYIIAAQKPLTSTLPANNRVEPIDIGSLGPTEVHDALWMIVASIQDGQMLDVGTVKLQVRSMFAMVGTVVRTLTGVGPATAAEACP